MIPVVGQHIKCFLRNNNVVDGVVEEWSDTQVVLKSLDGESFLILHHPTDDIALTKIILDNLPKTEEKNNKSKIIKTELEQEFHDIADEPGIDDIKNKSLALLKIELNKADRKIIMEKLRSHRVEEVRKVKYGNPGFFKKPISE